MQCQKEKQHLNSPLRFLFHLTFLRGFLQTCTTETPGLNEKVYGSHDRELTNLQPHCGSVSDEQGWEYTTGAFNDLWMALLSSCLLVPKLKSRPYWEIDNRARKQSAREGAGYKFTPNLSFTMNFIKRVSLLSNLDDTFYDFKVHLFITLLLCTFTSSLVLWCLP